MRSGSTDPLPSDAWSVPLTSHALSLTALSLFERPPAHPRHVRKRRPTRGRCPPRDVYNAASTTPCERRAFDSAMPTLAVARHTNTSTC